ncbi:hypothetical protein GGS21DRAFT_486846 [Xylaria nigripes]|nr:hypothetical protein GGS21DRAFT_486846 [Xylaria nigripes]
MSRHGDKYPPGGSTTDYYANSNGIGGPAGALLPNPYQLRLTYEPDGASHAVRSQSETPQVPRAHSQQASPPSPSGLSRSGNHEKGVAHSDGNDSEDERARWAIEKAINFVDNTFTDSTTGLSVGVLGALVGGLAGREAVDLTSGRPQHKGSHVDEDENEFELRRNKLIGTLVGAAIGALGANAVEKRIELRRAREETKLNKSEVKWRLDADGDAEHLRSKGRVHHGHQWGASGGSEECGRGGSGRNKRGIERETERRNRSWNTVEDWILNGSSGSEYEYERDHDLNRDHDHDHGRDRSHRPWSSRPRSR